MPVTRVGVVGWGSMLEIGLYSAIAPWVLLLVSSVWRYPAILEEVVKWGILKTSKIGESKAAISKGLVVGLVFGLSEAILYSLNGWQSGEWGTLLMRFLLTVPMHMVTATIIAYAMSKRMVVVGLTTAMIIHAGFNYWVR